MKLKESLYYINTPKQSILDFYDCKNDNFHVKIVIALFSVVVWLKNKFGYTHNLFLSNKKKEK